MPTAFKYITFSTLALISIVLVFDMYVTFNSDSSTFSSMESLPDNRVALLLGTSHKVRGGYTNYYYINRIKAAISLYENGKVKKIICSGDNATRSYNEPIQMQKDLIKGGVSPDDIILDYAGFRTLDSVVRAKEIFGQNNITIVSQKFHNERALFIAKNKGIEAVAFNAAGVDNNSKWKLLLREKFARAKMALDLILDKQPKFLGQPIPIP